MRGRGGFALPSWRRKKNPPPQIHERPSLPSQRVVFCQLKEALAVDWSGEKAAAALKRTAPDYFLLQGESLPLNSRSFSLPPSGKFRFVSSRSPWFLPNCRQRSRQLLGCTPEPVTGVTHSFSLPLSVLLKFRTDNGRDPSPQNYAEDSKLLLQIRRDVLEALGIGADLLPDEFVRCGGEPSASPALR